MINNVDILNVEIEAYEEIFELINKRYVDYCTKEKDTAGHAGKKWKIKDKLEKRPQMEMVRLYQNRKWEVHRKWEIL
ncbi:hypothetical protein NSA24_11420 [Clostridioides mangenotii]|uniref:hypothetical protein n=1 Tax=Metaclostridioides mangenotii TaxID=1540 RepID=UPI002149E0DA|nr:hypothetical protein [Clostridioides mangenotii]MCR1955403.1 hypothetical protein [Clostridioides mangenotii]